MEYPNFCAGSYQSQSPLADQELTMNLYPERAESPGATTRWALYPTPGVEEIAAAATGPGRAHFFEAAREFAVIGSTFWEIASDGTMTSRGTVETDANPATISSNGDGGGELFVTSGGDGYIYDLVANTLTQVSALDGKATMGGHLEGYFLVLDAATSTVYASELLDGTTWNTGTSFAQRSLASDRWTALYVVTRNVWFVGEQTSEAWYNAGSTPFPFSPHPSGLIQHGTAAPFSGVVLDGALCLLAASHSGRGSVVRISGFTPEVVSTYALQNAINGYTTISDAVGDGYNDLGHSFYLLNFPAQGATHAWDAQTLLWADRGTWVSEQNKYVAWRPRYHVVAFGEHRWLDAQTGAVYRSSSDLFHDVDGRPIRRMRRAPALVQENERIFYPGFELLLEAGLGTSDPAEPSWESSMPAATAQSWETGLEAFWRLGEPSGTRFDSRGANHLADNNTVTMAVGKVDNAGQFVRANNEFLSIASNASLSTGDIDFSVFGWVYADTLAASMVPVGKWLATGDQREYQVRWDLTTKSLTFTISNDGVATGTVGTGLNSVTATGTWYFFVAWHDSVADTINIQLNNGTVQSNPHATGVFAGTAKFQIGSAEAASTTAWDGRIDAVGFAKRVFTAAERGDLYNGGMGVEPVTPPGAAPDAFWRLGEESGTRADFSGSNDLTDNNTVTRAAGKVGFAAQFVRANTEYLSIASNPELSTGDIDFTLWGWVYPDTLAATMIVCAKWLEVGAIQMEYLVQWNAVGQYLQFVVSENGVSLPFGQVTTGTNSVTATDTWYFFVAWHDSVANTINIQLNNGTVQRSAHSTGVFSGTAAFQIGASGEPPPNSWNGRIDAVGFAKRLYTAAERTALYNAGRGFEPATLLNQGEDPQVMLRMSGDGGKTWGAELWRSAGKIGEYSTRVRWDRLGAARKRVFEVTLTDPIPWRILGSFLTPDPIRSNGQRAGGGR